MSERELQIEIRLALAKIQGLVVWRNNCGVAEINGARIRYGVGNPGGADLIGLYRGKFLAIEIKTPTGRQSVAQKMFADVVVANGGRYLILRSVDDVAGIEAA